MAKRKCRVCGGEFELNKAEVYRTSETKGAIAAICAGEKKYDTIDCPECGCQNLICERKPRTAQEDELQSGLNELAAEIHENAKEHGWWDSPPSLPEAIALMHSEFSEALEEYRNGNNTNKISFACDTTPGYVSANCIGEKKKGDCEACEHYKPFGIAVEFADTIMRILDYCAYAEIDIDDAIRRKLEYNKTRPYKHGGKVV